jgi:exosome complex component RRP41
MNSFIASCVLDATLIIIFAVVICFAFWICPTPGALSAAINATTLAMIDAGVPMRDFITSCSAAFISGTPLLGIVSALHHPTRVHEVLTPFIISLSLSLYADPNFVENTAGGPELLVAIEPKSQLVVSMEMESKLPMEMYERVAKLAIDGCNLIYRVLTDEVRDYTLQLYQARSGIGSA